MARHASTYRQARRATYREVLADGMTLTWAQFNVPSRAPSGSGNYHFGAIRASAAPVGFSRSKYMPHIGAKQRAKSSLTVSEAA